MGACAAISGGVSAVTSPRFFSGGIGPVTYALASLAAVLNQHVFILLIMWAQGEPLAVHPLHFAINPLRVLVLGSLSSEAALLLAFAWSIAMSWLLIALAFSRAIRARLQPVIAPFVVFPVVQFGLILWFALAKPKPETAASAPERIPATAPVSASVQQIAYGALAGAALCVVLTAFSTLVLRSYGYAVFVAMPFVIGVTTAYIANRRTDIGDEASFSAAMAALGVGALLLMAVAVEGAICLVMAAPLTIMLGGIGGIVGRFTARAIHRRRATLMSLAILPAMFLGEAFFPPRAEFVTTEHVDITASPEQVWNAIVHMGEVPDPPSAPFGWGLAYPVSGVIKGEGVGAIREGHFSTGVAYERVTVWEPGQRLWFDVLSNPPALKELSPHDHVHAPHLADYFTTQYAHFTITPQADGTTRLTLETRHDLNLEPAIYWAPIARWAIHENKTRVLNHFRLRAEGVR
jgi:hypothetical protein